MIPYKAWTWTPPLGVVDHVILVSAQGPNGVLFSLGDCWDRGLDLDFDKGMTKIGIWI